MAVESPLAPPVTLRAQGVMRLLPAAFLAFWLCGWFVGECFALAAVAGALHSLFGFPVPEWLDKVHTPANAAIPILAFLAVWLTFWTMGGVGAMAAFAGLLWGSEEVAWDAEQIEVRQRAFPFSRTVRVPWADVWRIEASSVGFGKLSGSIVGSVTAMTARGRKPIATMGSTEERAALGEQLRGALQSLRPDAERDPRAAAPFVRAASGEAPALPAQWKVEPDEAGQLALVQPVGPLRIGAAILAGLGAVLALVGWNIARRSAVADGSRDPWVGVFVLALLSAALFVGATVMAATRRSLHPRGGGLVDRTVRFGRTSERQWSPARLELQASRDSDGDEWWKLVVSGPGASPVTLESHINDPGPALALGRWLSERGGLPFADASPDSRSPAA